MATERQIPTLAGAIVSNQHCFEPLPEADTQWAIEHPEDAIGLFVQTVKNRGQQAAQAVQEAAATAKEIVKRALTAWRTIKSGGVPKEELAKKVVKGCDEVSDDAKDIMSKDPFVTAEKAANVDLVILTPADLGFTSNPRTDAFLTKEFCAEWSAKNLDGCVIELCEPEDGPQLRLQYDDQPNGEVLWMAMESITDSDGDPRVFRVERGDDGKRWLFTIWAFPRGEWLLGPRLVFRLRKVPLSSAA